VEGAEIVNGNVLKVPKGVRKEYGEAEARGLVSDPMGLIPWSIGGDWRTTQSQVPPN
jgi:hypothetical protein